VAENNLDGIGREPRAPGNQQANAEELLAELVRLVESSGLAPKRPTPPVGTVSERNLPHGEPTRPLKTKPLPPEPSSKPNEAAVVEVQPLRAPKSDSSDPNRIGSAAGRRSGTWTIGVSALGLAGAAVIGSIFWLEQIKPEPSKAPFIAAAQGPTPVQPPGDPSVATSSDAEATPPRDIAESTEIKAAGPEERPTDPTSRASLENPPRSQDMAPAAIGAAQQTTATAATPSAGPVSTPALAEPVAASPPAALESPDSKAAPTVSLPPEPTLTQTPTPSTADSGAAARPNEAPLPPVRPATKAAIQAGRAAQPSTTKLDLPIKPSGQSSAHVLAKAGATSPGAPETPNEPLRRGTHLNPENGAKTFKAAQPSVEPPAAPSAQSGPAAQQPAPQPNPNPVARAFGSVAGVVGAVASLIPFAPH